jgi:hypothetical protein
MGRDVMGGGLECALRALLDNQPWMIGKTSAGW